MPQLFPVSISLTSVPSGWSCHGRVELSPSSVNIKNQPVQTDSHSHTLIQPGVGYDLVRQWVSELPALYASIRAGYASIGAGDAGIRAGYAGIKPGYAGIKAGYAGIRAGYAGIRPGYAGIRPGYAGIRAGYAGIRVGMQVLEWVCRY